MSGLGGAERVPAIPGYVVQRELGRGGMGVVFLARDEARDRLVAIKRITGGREANAATLGRFRVEAGAVASLQHPQIIKIHRIGLHDGSPFLVMEYAPSGNLAELLDGRPRTPRWAAEAVLGLARALEHAHSRGVLHRDLKPANILATADGTLKISDFGLAKFTRPEQEVVEHATIGLSMHMFESLIARAKRDEMTTEVDFSDPLVTNWIDEWKSQCDGLLDVEGVDAARDLTGVGAVLGTLVYMAPEQAAGRNEVVGPAADIYALGAVLFQMLTGRAPFAGLSVTEILRRKPIEVPRMADGKVALELEAVCAKCMQVAIERRYRTCGELADDLGRFLEGYRTTAAQDGSSKTADRVYSAVQASADLPSTEPHSTVIGSQATRTWWPFKRRPK